MDIQIRTVEQIVVVELNGTIDGKTSPQVQAQVEPLIQPGSRIVLDMTGVTYMSSAGLRLLVATHRQVAENSGKLVLAGLVERVRDMMSITGFLPFFTIYDTVQAALTALQ